MSSESNLLPTLGRPGAGPVEAADYILETFPIVKRKVIAAHGGYRTKRFILEAYDAMTEATDTGMAYYSSLQESAAGASPDTTAEVEQWLA